MTRAATAMRHPHTARKSSLRSLQLEEAHVQQRRPSPAKNKYINVFYKPLFFLICFHFLVKVIISCGLTSTLLSGKVTFLTSPFLNRNLLPDPFCRPLLYSEHPWAWLPSALPLRTLRGPPSWGLCLCQQSPGLQQR